MCTDQEAEPPAAPGDNLSPGPPPNAPLFDPTLAQTGQTVKGGPPATRRALQAQLRVAQAELRRHALKTVGHQDLAEALVAQVVKRLRASGTFPEPRVALRLLNGFIARWRATRPVAQRALQEARPILVRMARSLLREPRAADEAVSAVLERAWLRCPPDDLDCPAKWLSWCRGILKNVLREMAREHARHVPTEAEQVEVLSTARYSAASDTPLDLNEVEQCMRVFEALPVVDRAHLRNNILRRDPASGKGRSGVLHARRRFAERLDQLKLLPDEYRHFLKKPPRNDNGRSASVRRRRPRRSK